MVVHDSKTDRWRLVLPNGRRGPIVDQTTATLHLLAAAAQPSRREPAVRLTAAERRAKQNARALGLDKGRP